MTPSDPNAPNILHQRYDKSVDCVELYLKYHYLTDPDSYQSVEWGDAATNPDGTFTVMHTFKAKNGFGGLVEQTKWFQISKDGQRVIGVN